ncbi:MAG TPA: hypothetical protein VFM58_15935 [Solirubrobacteraceae bacterium]|nr:hypothetical protein [Solirubrobacteraceae bacterium]
MRTPAEVRLVLALGRAGATPSEITRLTGVARTTVRNWLAGATPMRAEDPTDVLAALPATPYAYLLGLYLGDGTIARFPRASCLRIYCDAQYPGIIGECVRAIRAVRPHNRVSVSRRGTARCCVVQSYSTWWIELFPQHGSGRKHERPIVLADWQRAITHAHPQAFLRGLLHSDGTRFMNSVRHGDRVYVYPRYQFSNRSEDIKGIFCEHLDLLGIAWRRANAMNISIARREAAAALDEFVGPKR